VRLRSTNANAAAVRLPSAAFHHNRNPDVRAPFQFMYSHSRVDERAARHAAASSQNGSFVVASPPNHDQRIAGSCCNGGVTKFTNHDTETSA
jgi:hypothetical protein